MPTFSKSLIAAAIVAAAISPIAASPSKVECGVDYSDPSLTADGGTGPPCSNYASTFQAGSTVTIKDNGHGKVSVTLVGTDSHIAWLSDNNGATITAASKGAIKGCGTAWHLGKDNAGPGGAALGAGEEIPEAQTVAFTITGTGNVKFGVGHAGSGTDMYQATSTFDVTPATADVAETCSDSIQNQDEEGVDCGGTNAGCAACAGESAESWDEDRLMLTNKGTKEACYYVLFGTTKCQGGGVYKISESWFGGHFGGAYSSDHFARGGGSVTTDKSVMRPHGKMGGKCGGVIGPANGQDGWLPIDGGHGQYKNNINNRENLGANAIWIANWAECDGVVQVNTGEPTTQEPTTDSGESTFDVEEICKDTKTYAVLTLQDGENQVFCAKYDAAKKEFQFNFLIKSTRQWGAVGFNPNGATMSGTEVMWLGDDGSGPALQYKKNNNGYGKPSTLNVVPKDLTIEKVNGNIQAQWTRPLKSAGLMDLPADTSTLTTINAWKAGTAGGFDYHDAKETFEGTVDFSSAGSSAAGKNKGGGTKGALVHGALMILAWGCLSPSATIWMKYGKHLPVAIWFKGHVRVQASAILVTVVGIIVIFSTKVKFSELTGDSQKHGLFGIIVLVLAIFQGLLGAFREKIAGEAVDSDAELTHGPRRWLFNLLHRTNGWALFGLSLFTINLGIGLFHDDLVNVGPKAWLQDPAIALFQAYSFIALGLVLLLEVLHLFGGTEQDLAKGGPFNCSGRKSVGATFTATAAWEMKVRSIAISVFTALSISSTVALWVIIGGTEAEDWGKE